MPDGRFRPAIHLFLAPWIPVTGLVNNLRAIALKLLLLAFVAGGTGVLVGLQFLPTAAALTDAISSFERQVLDVPPLPGAEFQPENSYIYAADGSEIAEIAFEQRRIPVAIAEVPDVMINAVIATEDADFWDHNGLDYQALVRAAVGNVSAGEVTSGGSTITQQYVENAYLPVGERFDTIGEKITEALWAIEIERRLSKAEILEGYLNRTYFGNGVYGIGTAAEYYFGKTASQLGLAESAMLAGMIRLPEGNNPVDDPTAARGRRDIVLNQMVANGFVTREQADRAMEIPVDAMLDIHDVEAFDYPFWVDWVTRLLVSEPAAEGLGTQLAALEAMGDGENDRIQTVFQSGIRVFTTLDPAMQAHAEASIRKHLPDAATDPLGGIISVEPGTGAIRTMAVGPKEFGECNPEEAGTDPEGRLLCDKTKFNPLVPADAGSTRVGRQPGSAFKPFIIAAALEQGIPPGWEIEATGPQTIPECDNGQDWVVHNSGGDGIRDMYSGVAGSSNVFHARLIKEIGPAAAANMARRLGVTRSQLDAVCSLALGAREVFPLEMATGYATLANRGEYCAPFAIERIEDPQGRILYQHSANCRQVLDRSIADRVVDIMQGPVNAGGTAGFMSGAMSPYPVRGKTGTTNDYVDAWFVGYVKQLATASWVGYENGLTVFESEELARKACRLPDSAEFGDTPRCAERRLMNRVTIGGQFYSRVFGGTIPAPMWRDYMVPTVNEFFEPVSFAPPGPQPQSIVPDVTVFETVAEIEEALGAVRLNLILTEQEHYAPPGTFVGQFPEPGTQVIAGRSVEVFVSNGEGTPPAVPNVVGMTEYDAVVMLQEIGYEVARVRRRVNDLDNECGYVLAQNPEEGTEATPEDTTIVIQVGTDIFGGTCGRGVDDHEGEPPPDDEPPNVDQPPDEEPPPDEPPPDDGTTTNGNGRGRGNGGGGGG